MKKALLVLVCLAGSAFAYTQVVPHYGEVYNERTNRLAYKHWFSPNGNVRQEIIHDDGKTRVVIYLRDVNKYYTLDMENKTYMALPLSQLSDFNRMIGTRVLEGVNTKIETIGQEVVEGKMCNHYRYTRTTLLTNGSTESLIWDEWIYPPLNTWVRRHDGGPGNDPPCPTKHSARVAARQFI